MLDSVLLIKNPSEGTQRNVVAALSDAWRFFAQWWVQVHFAVQSTSEALRPLATQGKPKTGGPVTNPR